MFRQIRTLTDDDISLGFLCGFEAFGGFEEHLKFCACFGRFDLRFAVIAVLNDSNLAFLNGFENIQRCAVVFYGIELWFSADMLTAIRYKVSFGG